MYYIYTPIHIYIQTYIHIHTHTHTYTTYYYNTKGHTTYRTMEHSIPKEHKHTHKDNQQYSMNTIVMLLEIVVTTHGVCV